MTRVILALSAAATISLAIIGYYLWRFARTASFEDTRCPLCGWPAETFEELERHEDWHNEVAG